MNKVKNLPCKSDTWCQDTQYQDTPCQDMSAANNQDQTDADISKAIKTLCEKLKENCKPVQIMFVNSINVSPEQTTLTQEKDRG